MRLIDADEFSTEHINTGENDYEIGFDNGVQMMLDEIKDAPTIDAIPIKVIESWLSSIAINNVGHKFGGGTFEECCNEIIKRLDGLVWYNADLKEGEQDEQG